MCDLFTATVTNKASLFSQHMQDCMRPRGLLVSDLLSEVVIVCCSRQVQSIGRRACRSEPEAAGEPPAAPLVGKRVVV